jgi:hypothetical protein
MRRPRVRFTTRNAKFGLWLVADLFADCVYVLICLVVCRISLGPGLACLANAVRRRGAMDILLGLAAVPLALLGAWAAFGAAVMALKFLLDLPCGTLAMFEMLVEGQDTPGSRADGPPAGASGRL